MRAIHTAAENGPGDPEWMAAFLLRLERDDLAPATVRGYRYDLRHFLVWRRTVQDGIFAIHDLAEHDLIAYRQHMVAAGRRPTFPPTLTSYATLRAIRYHALLHGWAFRPY